MFQHQGVWLPDGEKHFPEWMDKNGELVDGRGTYQIKKLRAALRHCRQTRVAIDIGGHVGLWSMQLVRQFSQVFAFEPVAEFRACFERNMQGNPPGAGIWVLGECALGAVPGRVSMRVDPADTGGTHVAGAGEIPMRALDEFEMSRIDFIKIDCEGYELEVLRGAEMTLRENRPVVIVEQKPHKLKPNFGIEGTPAVDYLLALGAKQREVISGDYILSWD